MPSTMASCSRSISSPSRRILASRTTTTALLLFSAISAVSAAPFLGTLIDRDSVEQVYDYVIVGGGVSGLVVANRLTEDPNTTVLVIEAGKIDNQEERMLFPRFLNDANINNTWGNPTYTSAPMPQLNNRTFRVMVPKVLGGGSAINGMMFDRGSAGDYDLWGDLIEDPSWGYPGLLPYFKKSEHFTPPSAELQAEYGITYDMAYHGTTGPVYASYPPHVYETAKTFHQAAQQLGIPTPIDAGSGEALGVIWTPNAVHPTLIQRSYARNTYHTLAENRPNYHVLSETTVTKLINRGQGTVNLSWVEYTPSSSTNYATATKYRVKANKEIIMAAGSVHTPRILQLSGIGPRSLLESFDIDVLIDLPGVGENFQDHPIALLAFNNTYVPSSQRQDPSQLYMNATFDALMGAEYRMNHTGPWTVGAGNILGFMTAEMVNLSASIIAGLEAQPPGQYLRPGLDATVIAGYERQKQAILNRIKDGSVAIVETTFTPASSLDGLMKPLSRGYIHITANDPFADPIIDFRPLTNPFDWDITLATTRWQQQVFIQAPIIQALNVVPVSPNPSANDEAMKNEIRPTMFPSFSHLVGTCPMMKLEHGGVVDKHLKVYGTNGKLRIVDASMMPVIPGTHTQSTVYAVAEKAADIIKSGV